ncbi:MAG: hypothetical protein AAF196_14890 [Planctomycetota bacterium]
MRSPGVRRPWRGLILLAILACTGCTWLPNEFNLSPLYRQRLDKDGNLLELDVLWPLIHIEKDPVDQDLDIRLRPFVRRLEISEDENWIAGYDAVEYQYLAPLGLYRRDGEQTRSRFFPLWSYTDRIGSDGLRETDWYALFPLFWGGTREDGEEDYFGFFPFYADLPNFLIQERITYILFPLYTRTKKSGRTGHHILWPLGGWGVRDETGEVLWARALPFFSRTDHTETTHTTILWPFISWGVTNKSGPDPVHRWLIWPFFGRTESESGRAWGWTFLNPFFQYLEIEGRRKKLDLFWPIFRYEEDLSESSPVYQWWVWPLVARTVTNDQWAWNFLWPLIWWQEYDDPEGLQQQRWFLPFYWTVNRDGVDESTDDFDHVWPVYHRDVVTYPDGTEEGEWSLLSPFPYRDSTARGISEAYDWLWTLARRRWRGDDDRFELFAHLYSSRTRGDHVQKSVPFLFNYEDDGEDRVLRLFQFIPIPLGPSASKSNDPASDPAAAEQATNPSEDSE